MLILIFTNQCKAQNTIINGVSGFYVKEKNNLSIGFVSTTLDYPIKSYNKIKYQGGLQFIGSAVGNRGGYFAFGYRIEGELTSEKKIKFGGNFALLAGGGGSAPDKDGWMLHGTIFSQYQTRNSLKLRLGVSYTHVSSSMIRGFSPSIGVYWNLSSSKNDSLSTSKGIEWNSVYSEFGVAKFKLNKLEFIGVGASWKKGKWLTGDVSINALTNIYGGYMQALFSTGISLGTSKFQFSPAFVGGVGGGGGVSIGGGMLIGIQGSVRYFGLKSNFGVKYQIVNAGKGDFRYQGLFFSFGKSISKNNRANFKFYPVFKGYVGPNRFCNLGLRLVAIDWKLVKVMGSTYWAFTNNKGAYAEGLFEFSIDAPFSIPVYAIGSVGAGAGGGINKNVESIIRGVGFGVKSLWNKIPFAIESTYWKGGNVPKFSLTLVCFPFFK